MSLLHNLSEDQKARSLYSHSHDSNLCVYHNSHETNNYAGIGEYLDQLIPSRESANELFDILDTYDAIPELYIALLKDEMFQYLDNNKQMKVLDQINEVFDPVFISETLIRHE